jgi:hypothetical protein
MEIRLAAKALIVTALGKQNLETINHGGIGFDMKTPIVLSENGDLSIYDSVSELESHIEPVDVLNSEYEIFDSEGKLLVAKIESRRGSGLFGFLGGKVKFVKVFQPPEALIQEERLHKLLVKYLQKPSEPEDSFGALTLLELIEKAR